jgi:type IV pilus assembly protein PilV
MAPMLRLRAGALAGFAMIEVLITLVIILLGLLGVAALMVRANTSQMESYQRVQAVILLEDMRNRIEANRGVATCYANGPTGAQLGTGYGGTPTCVAGTAAQNAQAVADMTDWNAQLLGSAESKSGTKVGAMLGARGCVSEIDAANRIYLISVAWQGMASSAVPKVTCGQGQYGADDSLRRALSVTVRIGDLS